MSLLALPAELLLRIALELPPTDSHTLSASNSHLRRLLAPAIFKTLKACNNNIPEQTLAALPQLLAKYARHVKRLNFDLYLDQEDDDHASEPAFTLTTTPPVLWDLLARVNLPNAETVRLTFCPQPEDMSGDHWEDDGVGGTIYIFQEGEDDDDDAIKEKEREFHWRRLMNKSLESVAAGHPGLKRFELRNLCPKPSSAWSTDAWVAMMNGLEEFELSLFGGENGAGWHANTIEGYLDAIGALQRSMFAHLTAAKSFHLCADSMNPIGCEGWHNAPMPLIPSDLPKVEHLLLDNCFVDVALVKNLAHKPGQLKTLRLNNCMSGGTDEDKGIADVVMPWSDFFTAVRDSQGSSLQELSISEAPLTLDEYHHQRRLDPQQKNGRYEPREDESEDVSAVRKELETNPMRRAFSYITLDDKYGMVFPNEELNVTQFWQGDDQNEYDALMEMLNANKQP